MVQVGTGKCLIFQERGFMKISTEVSGNGHNQTHLPNMTFNIICIMRNSVWRCRGRVGCFSAGSHAIPKGYVGSILGRPSRQNQEKGHQHASDERH